MMVCWAHTILSKSAVSYYSIPHLNRQFLALILRIFYQIATKAKEYTGRYASNSRFVLHPSFQ